MSAFELSCVQFLLACLGCLAGGLAVWILSALCRRWLPELAMQRSFWLLSQLAVAVTCLVLLFPQSERLRVLPPIELAEPSSAQVYTAEAPAATSATPGLAPAQPAEAPTRQRNWIADGAQAWLFIYVCGLAHAIARLMLAQRLLNRLARSGSPLTAAQQHAGFGKTAAHAEVIEVDAPISPMLLGLFRPRLLLPRHLRSFDHLQQQLIVEHELTHLRRRDLHWMSAGLVLQTVLWFNPIMRLLRENLSWAQELGCDRDVLRGRPQAERKAYAAALLAQLRLQRHPGMPALAFGDVGANTMTERVLLVRTPPAPARFGWTRWAALGSLALVFGANLALQPALAWDIDTLAGAVPEVPDPTAAAAAATAAAPAPAPQAISASSSTAAPDQAHAQASGPLACTAIVDAASGASLLREGRCGERVTPASTFNIAVSLMGYDSGFLRDEHAPKLPFRPGYPAWNPTWRTATDPASWLKNSVVWYAQQVTTALGTERFGHYIQRFNYGNQDLGGDAGKDNGLTYAWINSSLTISPIEQVAFLRNMVNRKLALSDQAYERTMRIMPRQTLANGWTVYGKTGTGAPVLPNGKDDFAHSYGWYVGWATKGQRTIVFARLVQDQQMVKGSAGPRARDAFLSDLPAQLQSL